MQMMIGRPLAQYLPHAATVRIGRRGAARRRALVPGQAPRCLVHGPPRRSRRAGRARRRRPIRGGDGAVWHRRGRARRVEVNGRPVKLSSPAARDRARHRSGAGGPQAPGDRSVRELLHNASLTILRRLSRLSWVQRPRERSVVGAYLDRLRVRASASHDAHRHAVRREPAEGRAGAVAGGASRRS